MKNLSLKFYVKVDFLAGSLAENALVDMKYLP